MRSKKRKGFTLIELIIVVAIIGILAAIAVPKFGEIQKNSKIKADVASAKVIADATLILVTEGKINTNQTLDVITSKHTGDSLSEKQKYENLLFDALQNIPKVQTINSSFDVGIDTNGNITVTVVSIAGFSGGELYPSQSSNYGNKKP